MMLPVAISQLAEMGREGNLDVYSIEAWWVAANKNGACDNIGRRLKVNGS
jgi:hypothetical protein